MFVIIVRKHFDWLFSIMIIFSTSLEWEMYLMLNVIFVLYDGHVACSISMASLLQQGRDKKGWIQRVGLANVSPKGLYPGIRG